MDISENLSKYGGKMTFSRKGINLSKMAGFYQLRAGFCGKTADGYLETKKYQKIKTIQGNTDFQSETSLLIILIYG